MSSLGFGCVRRPPAPPPLPSRHAGGDTAAKVVDGSTRSSDDPDRGPTFAPADGPPRTLALSEDDRFFERFEGEGRNNACAVDGDCFVGGCSGEVCSAEGDVVTVCAALVAELPASAQCGCVDASCRWYQTGGAPMSGKGVEPAPPPRQHADPPGARLPDCGGQTCKPGLRCVEYFGVAGPRGPRFQSCEIRCKRGDPDACPAGQQCRTIADGPGSVCR